MPPDEFTIYVTPLTKLVYDKPLFPPTHPQYSSGEERAESSQVRPGVSSVRENTSVEGNAFYTESSAQAMASDDLIISRNIEPLIEMGFPAKDVRVALQTYKEQGQCWTVEELVNTLVNGQYRDTALRTDSAIESAEAPQSTQAIGKYQTTECIRCEVNQANSLFLPCAHQSMCVDCAQDDVAVCPMCATDVREKIKTILV